MKNKLNLYTVRLPEVHIQSVQIVATTESEAIEKVLDGQGEQKNKPVYHCTIDDGSWEIKAELEYELSGEFTESEVSYINGSKDQLEGE
tara:strand:+ start:39 stop:305 length:267 start_codon:yes stop_codon:yes gene_type:complete